MRWPTASALERASACPGSCVYPHVDDLHESAPAERGNVLHAFLADVATIGTAAALERVPLAYRETCEALDMSKLPKLDPETCSPEVAFGYSLDQDMGRVLGVNVRDRAIYEKLGVRELGGTADFIGLAGETVIVIDWKTGRGDIPPASRNRQLRFLALAAARALGKESAKVAIVRIREDGSSFADWADVDMLDLAEIATDLRKLGMRIEQAQIDLARGHQPELARGPHCRYCPAFDSCPAQAQLVRAMVLTPEQVAQDAAMMVSNGQRAMAYRAWQEMKILTARVGDLIAGGAAHQPLDLGDGTYYGYAPGPEKVADAAACRRVLAAAVGEEKAAAAVTAETEYHATKADILGALTGMPKARREEVLVQLRAAGGLKSSPTMKEHKRKPDATDDKKEAA